MVLCAAALGSVTGCDGQPGQGDDLPADAASPFRPTEFIGDTQIACNIALERIYSDALTSAPVRAVSASVQVTDAGLNHRCLISFAASGDDGPAVDFEALVYQARDRSFALLSLEPIGP